MDPSTDTLDRLVQQSGQLYSLPTVAIQVLELTSNPEIDTHALKQCIENDPALTTKVLRVVNSSLFGLSREVSDLNQAVAMLGIKPLKLLVLGFSLPESLFTGLTSGVLNRYWRHTLIKAVAARELSQCVWRRPGDEAFIGGLLQDLGILVLIQQLGAPYVTCLERAYDQKADLIALESATLGFDHTQLSSRLLANWGLPETLVNAVAARPQADYQNEVPSAQRALAQILDLSELLAQLLTGRRPDVLRDLLDRARYRGMNAVHLDELTTQLQAKVEQLASVLSLDMPAGLDYRDILIEAHGRLAAVAEEAAGPLARRASDPLLDQGQSLLDEMQSLSSAARRLGRAGGGQSSGSAANRPSPRAARTAPTAVSAPQAEPAANVARDSTATDASDPGLVGRVMSAVTSCRQARSPLSLLAVEADRFDETVIARGLDGADQLLFRLEVACQTLDHPRAVCLRTGDARFSIVLPDCDRRRAVELGNQLVRGARRLEDDRPGVEGTAPSVSVGSATVALPPKNFVPGDLIESANRCLYAARSGGGNSVKSIEIY